MKTGYVALALLVVAGLSGYVGLRIGRSQAETRIETMEAECAEARAAASRAMPEPSGQASSASWPARRSAAI